ncbi:hypothetical protein ACPOLB_20195 [Rubrivivax sp. RP6-9]|uniref:hypothetical protein n=1 Tax=Rubrivivax sp. RP6-9 TaxID=3415750 RepID=UPI003CC5A824
MQTTTLSTAAVLAATLLATGCAGLPAAQMALPAPLAATQAETLQGLDGRQKGSFVLQALQGRYERSASRLDLFGALAFDRVGAGYDARTPDGRTVQAGCRGRQTAARAGVLSGAPQPYEVLCRFGGAVSGTLTLAADGAASALGTQAARSGRVEFGGTVLALRSVHRVQGSPLPLEAPIGYVFTQDGRPVGAVELNGTPRLWRPAAGTPAHDAVTHAALALALLWDPA